MILKWCDELKPVGIGLGREDLLDEFVFLGACGGVDFLILKTKKHLLFLWGVGIGWGWKDLMVFWGTF